MQNLEINDLQVLDYDLFGKCNDMISFINSRKQTQITDSQMKVVAKLTNLLINFIKTYDTSRLSTLPEYHDILYIAKNNLQSDLRKMQNEKQQLEIKKNDLQEKNRIQALSIYKFEQDIQNKAKEINQLKQEKNALKDFIEKLEQQGDKLVMEFNSENQQLIEHNFQLQNQVILYQNTLKSRDEKIQKQEGQIKIFEIELKKLKTDLSQDRKNKLFYQQQEIFCENQRLKDCINQLFSQNTPLIQSNIEDDGQPQMQEPINQILISQLEQSQNNILAYLNKLSMSGIFLCACVGAYAIIKYNE